MPELEFDHEYFLFAGRVWFVGPFPRPATTNLLLDRILMTVAGNAEIGIRKVPTIFSDQNLADRCIANLAKTRPDKAEKLKPFSTPTISDFANALDYLVSRGHSEIAIDPDGARSRVIPISRLRESIREKLNDG